MHEFSRSPISLGLCIQGRSVIYSFSLANTCPEVEKFVKLLNHAPSVLVIMVIDFYSAHEL